MEQVSDGRDGKVRVEEFYSEQAGEDDDIVNHMSQPEREQLAMDLQRSISNIEREMLRINKTNKS